MLRRISGRRDAPAHDIAPEPQSPAEPEPLAPTPEELAFPADYSRAEEVWRLTLRDHPHVSDRESRLCELVEYFGWEIGQKAPYATPWFYRDDPRYERYARQLGVPHGWTYAILHMYSLFNRMDPERPDFFWLYDGTLRRLEELGGPDAVSVLDFGAGLGQVGLAFAAAGYRTVMTELASEYLDFVRWRAQNRRLEPVLHHASEERDYFDTAADGHRFGLVVEWSAFEHVHEPIPALEAVTGGLVPGGMFVTTTFKKDWTPELREHYRRDSAGDGVGTDYMADEVDAWLDERFDVLSPPKTLAKVLVKR